MKYLLFAGFFCLLFSTAFAFMVGGVDYSNLFSISSMDATAHACKPPCTYPNTVNVPTQYFANCTDASATRILGLSAATNAHAEQMSSNNYTGTSICLNNTVFTSFPTLCYFTAPGVACNTGYNCAFGLSGNTNAHPSLCGVFSNEVKFCCVFNSVASCPINFSINKNPPDFNHPADVNFVYSCPPATVIGEEFPMDLIIKDSFGYTKTIPLSVKGIGGNACSAFEKWYLVNTSQLLSGMGGDVSHNFTAVLKSQTSPCSSSEATFIVRQGASTGSGTGAVPIIPIIPSGVDCNIKSLSAQNILVDSNVDVSYSCYYSDPIGTKTATFSITNPYSAFVVGPVSVPCSTDQIHFRDLKIDSKDSNLPAGVYTAKLGVGTCSREFFFSATSATKSQSVPDIGLIPVLISLLVVVFFAFEKKKRK